MIPKEFKKTTKNKTEYDNHMAQFEHDDMPEEYNHYLDSEIAEKEFKESPEYKLQETTKQSFSNEYKQLTEANIYFLGCTFNSYTSTYETRFQAFKDLYIDAEEHNFVIEELEHLNNYQFHDFIVEDLKKNIFYSLEKTRDFLQDKLKSLGYRIENNISVDGEFTTVAIKDTSIIRLEETPSIDLSDIKQIDRSSNKETNNPIRTF
jgi:hypothetical protein